MNRLGYVKYTVDDYLDLEKHIVGMIKDFLDANEVVYIYGAGGFGRLVMRFMQRHGNMGERISGFIVADKRNNPDYVGGKKVFSVEDVDLTFAGVVLALRIEHHAEVIENLERKHCQSTLAFDAYEYNHMHWCNHHLSTKLIDEYRDYWAAERESYANINDWENVLIVCLDRIGDVILNIPFIRELRHNLNNKAKIAMVVQAGPASFMELCPYVDKLIVYDRKYAGEEAEESILKSKCYAEKYLKAEAYDVAIVTGWHNIDLESLFLAVFSSARLRIGFSEHNMSHKEFCNMGFDRFLSLPIKSVSVMHDVERELSILTVTGGHVTSSSLEIWTREEDKAFADRFFAKRELGNLMVIALVPHSLDGARMWDWKNYVELIDQINKRYKNTFFLLLGGKDANDVCSKIYASSLHNNMLDISGSTSLREVAEIMRRCHLYIGADTGLAHLAAAVKLPTIEIICHSNEGDPLEYPSPNRYRAWGNRSYIVRPEKALPGCGATCYKRRAHCINQIPVQDVMPVVEEALADIK